MTDTIDDRPSTATGAEDDTIARLAAHHTPGGTPRLPRLYPMRGNPLLEYFTDRVDDGSEAEPALRVTSDGFAPEGGEPPEGPGNGTTGPRTAGFFDYSPPESLFAGTDDAPALAALDPWAILGLEHGVDADAVRAAHRRLLTELHPDRFVTAPESERRAATERLAEVNQAFHELERTF